MIVLMASERQAEAFDRIGDETGRAVVLTGIGKRLEQAQAVVAGEIGHQRREFGIGAFGDQAGEIALVAELVFEALAPAGAALEAQGGIERVRAAVDPGAQACAARLLERGFEQRAVFQHDHVPAEGLEDFLEALPQAFAHVCIKGLPIVIDDPPGVPEALLPAFEQGFEDVALIELGIAHERDHPAFAPVLGPALRLHIILHDRGEERLCDAQADRTGGEIDVVDVLGARGIALRTFVAAKILQLLLRLLAEQILDCVEDRRGMGLHRDPVFRPQHLEIERRHDGRERGRGSLMPADLHAIAAFAEVIGVVDGPGGEPENLLLDLAQEVQLAVAHVGCPQSPL